MGNRDHQTGMFDKKFGSLTVTHESRLSTRGTIRIWLCECKCGARLWVESGKLRNGHTYGCDVCTKSANCVICGEPFIKKRPNASTCSPWCSKMHQWKGKLHTPKAYCRICGDPIYWRDWNKTICGKPACKAQNLRDRRHPPIALVCQICGTVYAKRGRGVSSSRTCSPECKRELLERWKEDNPCSPERQKVYQYRSRGLHERAAQLQMLHLLKCIGEATSADANRNNHDSREGYHDENQQGHTS